MPKLETFKEVSLGGGFAVGSGCIVVSIILIAVCAIIFKRKGKDRINASL